MGSTEEAAREQEGVRESTMGQCKGRSRWEPEMASSVSASAALVAFLLEIPRCRHGMSTYYVGNTILCHLRNIGQSSSIPRSSI